MSLFVEYTKRPIAIGKRNPHFSWEVQLKGRGRKQSAYRILVATTEELLNSGKADLWDSGKVDSSQSVNVEYGGDELRSNMDCFWKVQVWDEKGDACGFGKAAYFGTALFDPSDWQAKWIGLGDPDEPIPDPDLIPMVMEEGTSGACRTDIEGSKLPKELAAFQPDLRSPLMRKSFTLDKPIRRARAFVSGLGLFELRLNGGKVGEDVLATPRTEFREKVYYSTYDITGALLQGENAVGVILGNGWYNGQRPYWSWQMPWFGSPRAIVQLEIEFEDGSTSRIGSDESWNGNWSPITFSCIYDGEDYDARLEQDGWDTPCFDAKEWSAVRCVRAPGGKLVALDHEANRVMKSFKPVAVCEPEPGVFVFDMGTVMTGWTRLRIPQGKTGGTVALRYAELQHENGMIDPGTAGGARQADLYIMRGIADESYEPRFTYHGFRYVEVTGFPGTPSLDAIEARFVHNAVAQAGTFECGHDLINKIHACTLQSQRCNLQMGVPTDDTQRAERLGWCGDAWSYAEESFYNLDAARFWAKWIADFYDQQDEETGLVSFICPLPCIKEDLVWSAAFILIPWWHYIYYGDRRILEASYPHLKKYIAYLERVGANDIPALPSGQIHKALFPCCKDRVPKKEDHGYLQRSRFGDHLATHEGGFGMGKDQPRSMATAFYYYDVATMVRIAEALGEVADAKKYRELSDRIKDAYNDNFFDVNLGYYDIGCQSAQALAIAFDLVPEEHRDRVVGYLNSSVNFRQRRITSGYAGTKWVVKAIGHSGRNDILWERATSTDYPSWGYMLHDNKTTITENWHGAASQCHTTLGAAIDEWFYWGLAGIRPDESAPGFEKIVIKPYMPRDLPWVKASLKTARGMIVSEWEQDGAKAVMKIKVPANCEALVCIPSESGVSECGVPVCGVEGVTLKSAASGETLLEVGSGEYCFEFTVS